MNALAPTPTGDRIARRPRRPARSRSGRKRTLRILLGVLAFIAAWGASAVIWGVPGLYLPALALVPVVWVVLILISRG